jgi:hypothetical protein
MRIGRSFNGVTVCVGTSPEAFGVGDVSKARRAVLSDFFAIVTLINIYRIYNYTKPPRSL